MAYNAADPTGGASGGQDPYNYQRNLATQRAAGAKAQNTDALQRRFAANGMSNSGAAITAQTNSDRDVQQNLENTEGNIGMEEAKSAIPFQLLDKQQEFQGQQAHLSRAQQESQFGRGLSEQKSEFGEKLGEQKSEFSQEMPLKTRALDLQSSQQGLDATAMEFNENLAKYQQGHSGGLLGAGGLLGTGLGTGGGGGFMNLGIG